MGAIKSESISLLQSIYKNLENFLNRWIVINSRYKQYYNMFLYFKNSIYIYSVFLICLPLINNIFQSLLNDQSI